MNPTDDQPRQREPQLPPELRLAVSDLGLESSSFRTVQRTGRSSSLRVWRSNEYVAVAAQDLRGQQANILEVEGRDWAESIGVPTPRILQYAPDGSWLVAEWIATLDPVGAQYCRAALSVADRIMAVPAPSFSQQVMSWRAGSRGRLQRAVRLIGAGLDPREFLAARSAAAALPQTATAHGDFYFRNVLAVPGDICVVDWEFTAPAPAYTDHLRFWSTTKSDADRELVMAQILDGRSRVERAHIGVLGRWLAFRLFAENVSAPRRLQTPSDREHSRRGLIEGRQLYVRTRS